ncbi:MAG: segregation/condensation protein A [Candidatus Paceibacterota bacterium]|jgi:segregation and condensation protein A
MPEIISQYKVKQNTFEGPLELLLSLIEQRKLFVNEISLADVTNEYIAHVKSLGEENRSINDVSYFILVAATLILIKSKSLLPNLNLTEDETEKIVDLEKRLRLYQTIKNASIDIKNNFGANIIFTPCERVWNEPLFSPDPVITVANIGKSIEDVLLQVPKKEIKLPEVEIKKIINIDEIINSLTDRIQSAMNISFREFSQSHGAGDKEEARVHVIVSFLAMLELVREGLIDVIQNASFGDIEMNKNKQEI